MATTNPPMEEIKLTPLDSNPETSSSPSMAKTSPPTTNGEEEEGVADEPNGFPSPSSTPSPLATGRNQQTSRHKICVLRFCHHYVFVLIHAVGILANLLLVSPDDASPPLASYISWSNDTISTNGDHEIYTNTRRFTHAGVQWIPVALHIVACLYHMFLVTPYMWRSYVAWLRNHVYDGFYYFLSAFSPFTFICAFILIGYTDVIVNLLACVVSLVGWMLMWMHVDVNADNRRRRVASAIANNIDLDDDNGFGLDNSVMVMDDEETPRDTLQQNAININNSPRCSYPFAASALCLFALIFSLVVATMIATTIARPVPLESWRSGVAAIVIVTQFALLSVHLFSLNPCACFPKYTTVALTLHWIWAIGVVLLSVLVCGGHPRTH